MIRHVVAAAIAVAFSATSLSPMAYTATQPKDDKALQVKKRKKAQADAKKKLIEASKRADALKKLKAEKATKEKKLVARKDCKGFLQCLFGTKRVRVTTNGRPQQYASLSSAGLSGRKTRQTVDWNEGQYPVGSIIIRTSERKLYYVNAKGEAIRYAIGVGREGFQWSGVNRISRKTEWPSWTPPAEMIRREAEKGKTLPPFMEGGPGNPLGARAMYVGGTIYRVHGTNNEASIGGAVSSGCIRMMNADVIDLYDRVRVGAKIYVYR